MEKYTGLKMQMIMQLSSEYTDEKLKDTALKTFTPREIELLKNVGWL